MEAATHANACAACSLKVVLYQLVPYLTMLNSGLIYRSSQSTCCHLVAKSNLNNNALQSIAFATVVVSK